MYFQNTPVEHSPKCDNEGHPFSEIPKTRDIPFQDIVLSATPRNRENVS
jgi:hypothetical protein